LLRPLAWIDQVGTQEGSSINLGMGEMGIAGPAAVVSTRGSARDTSFVVLLSSFYRQRNSPEK
jgi:hypothetical protein